MNACIVRCIMCEKYIMFLTNLCFSVQDLDKRVDLLSISSSIPDTHDFIINAFMESLNDVIGVMVSIIL